MGHPASPGRGCPIRTSPDHSLLAAPRGLSQPSTSFIGSWCQGIHRAPLLARRLDLSTSPSRQDQRSQKDLNNLSLSLPTTALGIGGTGPVSVCSTTLWFFRCARLLFNQRFRAAFGRSLEGASRGNSTLIQVEPPRPALSLYLQVQTQKRPDVRRATNGTREVVTADYAVVDSKLRMIPLLLEC
jgi:hypothetical protein